MDGDTIIIITREKSIALHFSKYQYKKPPD